MYSVPLVRRLSKRHAGQAELRGRYPYFYVFLEDLNEVRNAFGDLA